MAVDWSEVLEKFDREGLITSENRERAAFYCQVADARLRAQFPQAYRRLTDGEHDLVLQDLVTRAVFRVLRNDASGGYSREDDGVYSYTISGLTQSPDLWWTSADKELLAELTPPQFALGPLRRGGLSG